MDMKVHYKAMKSGVVSFLRVIIISEDTVKIPFQYLHNESNGVGPPKYKTIFYICTFQEFTRKSNDPRSKPLITSSPMSALHCNYIRIKTNLLWPLHA